MAYNWNCQYCSYSVWSPNRASLDADIKSHLFDHNLDKVTKRDFRYLWDCPYCSEARSTHDKETLITEFQSHLYEHASKRITNGSHVATRINGRGNVLVEAPVNGPSADHARAHFFAYGDIVVIVTRDPAKRLRLIEEKLAAWPAHTVVLTTKRRPLGEELDVDFSDISVEIVELDQRLGPDQLGETISRVIDQHNTAGQQLSFGFDIIYEIIQSFDLQTSYDFVSRVSSRLQDADAISHFYIKPHPQLESILNVLDDQFDLTVTVEDDLLRVS
jgi:hypothetical protein